jgi:hypothetical protein
MPSVGSVAQGERVDQEVRDHIDACRDLLGRAEAAVAEGDFASAIRAFGQVNIHAFKGHEKLEALTRVQAGA